MSLILDALRKSEAERLRGQAPDLFAPVAVQRAQRAKPPVAMMLVALAAMLAAATIVFWPSQPARRPAPDVAPEPKAAPDQQAPSMSLPRSAPRPPPPPPPNSATAPIEAINKSIGPTPAAAVDIAKPDEAKTPASSLGDAAVSAPTPDLADPAPPIDEPELLTLATLDSATRATLPPLQLSMHVWNPDATRRFAIIDGQRLGEGGKLAGVVVAQIRRDGVVLAIDDGRHFLLPRP